MADLMTPPETAEDFLSENGWAGAEILPVAGDASFRRYFRIVDRDRKAILMDAPPPHEDPRPFIEMANYLRAQDLAAPEIYATNLEHGLVLIEDFGDHRMREHLDDNPEDEVAIYKQVVDLAWQLHKKPAAQIAPYDWEQYLREVNLLTEWYCVQAQGLDIDQDGFVEAWRTVLQPVLEAQENTVTVMRDYHAENIMLLDDGRLGLLDFQDALAGHPAYDLVSMLQDARRDVSDELEEQMLQHYLRQCDADSDQFRSHYAILGAQRNTKIIGIFTRLCLRDGKRRYLDFLPRMWKLLEKDLRHPDLAPVVSWFDQNIPPDIRSKVIELEETAA